MSLPNRLRLRRRDLGLKRWWAIPQILWTDDAPAVVGLSFLVATGVIAELGILLLLSAAIGEVVPPTGGFVSGDRLGLLLAGIATFYLARFLVAPLAAATAASLDWRLRATSGSRLIGLVSHVDLADLENHHVADEWARVRGISLEAAFKPRAVSLYAEAVGQRLRFTALVAIVAWFALWPAVLMLAGASLYYGWARREVLTFLKGHLVGTDRFRRAGYFFDWAVDRPAAKEVRLFGLGAWIVDRFHSEQRDGLDQIHRQHRRVVDMIVVTILASAAIGSAFGLVLMDALSGRIEPGSLALVSGAILIGAATLVGGEGWVWALAASPFARLLQAEEKFAVSDSIHTKSNVELRRRLDVEALSFRYPRGDWVLRNLDLTIRAGESVAIVGRNGAGKTTLVKLLCRLYEPTAGRIQVDGMDLRMVGAEQWANRLAVVFQDFVHYPLSARDNVMVGRSLPRASSTAESAAEGAGVGDVIARLPDGWDTPLSRNYPAGSDLSGGEWQRMALARALAAAKDGAQLMILDEPTSSLDAEAEASFNERFLELVSGVTTIIVSHRFPTVRRADRILVLDGGAVVESGSHDQLIAADGLYARMFRIQASRFRGAE